MMSFNVRIEGISRKRTRRRGRQSECRCNQMKKIKLDSLGYVTLLLIESSIFSQKHWMGVVNTCCLSQLSRVDRSSSHPCPQAVFPSAVVQWFFQRFFTLKGKVHVTTMVLHSNNPAISNHQHASSRSWRKHPDVVQWGLAKRTSQVRSLAEVTCKSDWQECDGLDGYVMMFLPFQLSEHEVSC